jgi:outer membrane protein TolC
MDKTYDVMLGITLPLGWTGNKGAGVKEARYGRDMAEAEYKLEKNSVALETKEALINAKTSLRLLELYRTSVIPQAQEALKIAQTSYQSSKGGFLDLLDAERTLLDMKTDFYRFTVEYQTWLAELERLTGQNLTEEK